MTSPNICHSISPIDPSGRSGRQSWLNQQPPVEDCRSLVSRRYWRLYSTLRWRARLILAARLKLEEHVADPISSPSISREARRIYIYFNCGGVPLILTPINTMLQMSYRKKRWLCGFHTMREPLPEPQAFRSPTGALWTPRKPFFAPWREPLLLPPPDAEPA